MVSRNADLDALVERLPSPVAAPIARYLSAQHPYLALWRGCDALESVLRFSVIVQICVLRQSSSEGENLRLPEVLNRPTLHSWCNVVDWLMPLANKNESPRGALLPGFSTWVESELRALQSGEDGSDESSLLWLRNQLAHASVGDKTAVRWCRAWKPRLDRALKACEFLAETRLSVIYDDNHTMPLHGVVAQESHGLLGSDDSAVVSISWGGVDYGLRPFVRVQAIDLGGAETKIDSGALLVYYRREFGRAEFLAVDADLPPISLGGIARTEIDAAFASADARVAQRDKKEDAETCANENRIDLLFRGMVGRENDTQQVIDTARSHGETVLWIHGTAGIGKSAVLAAAVKRLEEAERPVVSFFPEPGSAAHVGRALHNRLWRFADRQTGKKLAIPEKNLKAACKQRLQQLKRHVLVVVDGLDEIEQDLPGFASDLAELAGEKVVVLCAGRATVALEASLANAIKVFPSGLSPLSDEHARGYLREALGPRRDQLMKQGVRAFDGFINDVVARAQGLPLYLSTVGADLASGRAAFEAAQLPNGLDAAFRQSLRRLQYGDTGAVLSASMTLLSIAGHLPRAALDALLSKSQFSELPTWPELLDRSLDLGRPHLRQNEEEWSLQHESLRLHLESSTDLAATRWWSKRSWLSTLARWNELAPEVQTVMLRESETVLARIEADADESLSVAARELRLRLATDETFLRALEVSQNGNPVGALRWIEQAATTAFDRNDLVRAAEAWCLGALWRSRTDIMDPLALLRSGNVEAAWNWAGRAEKDDAVRWKMLLLWELAATGQTEEAEAHWPEVVEQFEHRILNDGVIRLGPAFTALCMEAISALAPSIGVDYRSLNANKHSHLALDFGRSTLRFINEVTVSLEETKAALRSLDLNPLYRQDSGSDGSLFGMRYWETIEALENGGITEAREVQFRYPPAHPGQGFGLCYGYAAILAEEVKIGSRDVRGELADGIKCRRIGMQLLTLLSEANLAEAIDSALTDVCLRWLIAEELPDIGPMDRVFAAMLEGDTTKALATIRSEIDAHRENVSEDSPGLHQLRTVEAELRSNIIISMISNRDAAATRTAYRQVRNAVKDMEVVSNPAEPRRDLDDWKMLFMFLPLAFPYFLKKERPSSEMWPSLCNFWLKFHPFKDEVFDLIRETMSDSAFVRLPTLDRACVIHLLNFISSGGAIPEGMTDSERWELASGLPDMTGDTHDMEKFLSPSALDDDPNARVYILRRALDRMNLGLNSDPPRIDRAAIAVAMQLVSAHAVALQPAVPESGTREVYSWLITHRDSLSYGRHYIEQILRGLAVRNLNGALSTVRENGGRGQSEAMAQLAVILAEMNLGDEANAMMNEASSQGDRTDPRVAVKLVDFGMAFARVLLANGRLDAAITKALSLDCFEGRENLFDLAKHALTRRDIGSLRAVIRVIGPRLRAHDLSMFCRLMAHCNPSNERELAHTAYRSLTHPIIKDQVAAFRSRQ